MENEEIWKTYPEFDFIEGSNLGNIRTIDRYVTYKNGVRHFYKGNLLPQYRNNSGYLYVHFVVNGKNVNKLVHRLIAQTFIPNPDNLSEVNHRDNDPLNNNVSNLEWCTHEYNIAYREKHGISAKEYTKVLNRPVYAVNLKTLEVLRFESQSEASRELEANLGHINSVIKGKCQQAGGYWFTHADENAIENARSKFGDEVANRVAKLMEMI